ncbi:MAG: type VI secretion system membrane subunit TssM [Myxococcales bacterium]|nr:MAG: type VI secretion system membrane subunit TssM [Myxococcales bacterium]
MLMFWLALGLSLVALAAWIIVLVVHAPLWIGIVVTVVCVTAFLAVLIIRHVRAKMRASALETELLRQAAQQADSARPDRRIEVQRLQAQMKAAIQALKRTRLGARSGQAALYALPWYVIVGPPAAGKTTALTQSGLGFIAPPGSTSTKVRGTAGTRNCDWWFSPHAILLDTAGRLATGEDDRDEWLAFLDTLRKFRPRRPLEGVVVALSVEDLLSASEAELEETAKTLRARADEVMSRLEMVLPLYVVLTKVDLVAGFVDFWGDLGKSARAQTWGTTFGFEEELQDPEQAVGEELDVLERVLHARMLTRLGNEPLPEVRARILQFPLEFAALRRPLATFVGQLCQPNPYQETPLLRGFYFSSGTQTGRQLDRVLSNMARGFKLPAAGGGSPRQQTAPQSYFVTELFQKVIFPDRDLGLGSASRMKRRSVRQAVQIALVAVAMLTIVVPAALSYAENSELAQATARDAAQSLSLERAPGGGAGATAGALDLLVGRLLLLERADTEFHVRGYVGPYAAPELLQATKRVYLERLKSLVKGPVQTELLANVRATADLVRMDSQNFQTAYDDLKLYLMLCKTEHLEPEWATPRLAKVWAQALGSQSSTEEDKLLAHAKYYVEALQTDKTFAWTPDSSAISGAQGRLSAVPLEELRYGWLVEAAKGVPAIRPDKVFFGPAAQYWNALGNVEVPGLYTALGWQKVRGLLESPDARLELSTWVLGQDILPLADTKKTGADQLRELYFQRYGKAWAEFIAGLSVVVPSDMPTALDELRVISASDGPYVRLFKVISENVRLDVAPPKTLAEQALEKGKSAAAEQLASAGVDAGAPPPPRAVSPVERQFEPLLLFGFGEASAGKADAAPSRLSLYLAQLTTLEAALGQLAETNASPAQEFDAALSRTATSVQTLLGGLDTRTRFILEPLLMNPIRGSRKGAMNADFASLSESWQKEVWEIYSTKLANRYPFADAPAEVSLPEFTDFFRPDSGLLWKFFATNLATRLERAGSGYVPKAAADAMPFRPDFIQCLNVAAEITDATFGGAQAPSVPFAIKIHPAGSTVAEISLTVDGASTVYRNEPERWTPVVWPGTGSPRGAVLQVRGAGFTDEIPRAGDFGLFRLLEAGGLKPAPALSDGAGVQSGAWTLSRAGEAPVTLDLRPAKSVHPFVKGFFRRWRCPAAITTVSAR